MYMTPTPAILASALHKVFAKSRRAPDTLALWIDIAEEAVRELSMPVQPALVPWVPVVLRHQLTRTEGDFFPFTGSVRIMSGPLLGTTFADAHSAALGVVDATPTPVIDSDEGDTSAASEVAPKILPLWRFRTTGTPGAFTPRAVPPLIS
ncbi:hypothetical protein [Nocardia fluminea]|uniref:Uncharacterized protein n=1 Tax=Nocardia fluminea TaxID=134984 RepID=A0A2N3WYH7_9NOCA|nr:hypothetical protein [Nocardia fluminea]PKV98926.1 hypothetical protein ATK86_0960 [Nocardia fluminea]